jgi:hypothetical protein
LLTILAWDQHHWWREWESKAVALLYKKWIKQTSRHRSTGNWRLDLSNQLKIVTWCSPTSMTRKTLTCNPIIHEIDSVHVNNAENYRNHCRITSQQDKAGLLNQHTWYPDVRSCWPIRCPIVYTVHMYKRAAAEKLKKN